LKWIREATAGVDVPTRYLCPISLQVMQCPVRAPDGFYYERYHLSKWLDFDELRRSPVTYEPFGEVTLGCLDQEFYIEIHDFINRQATELLS